MPDPYRTFICTAENVEQIRNSFVDYVSMTGELTTDTENAAPPATHYFSAGACAPVGITSMEDSGLFLEITGDPWPVAIERNGLVRVEVVE